MSRRLFVTPFQSEQNTAFWVESTVPLNVEDQLVPGVPGTMTRNEDPEQSFKLLADAVRRSSGVVIAVHGFNIPKCVAERLFLKLASSVREAGKDALFIGYRWPSETVFSNVRSGLQAAPPTMVGAAIVLATVLAVIHLAFDNYLVDVALFAIAMALVGVFVSLWLLRSFVYFRDLDRATNHGIPDLVHLVRELDRVIQKPGGSDSARRIPLSFVAHSMGALIVVSAVRLLDEVLAPLDAEPGRVSPNFCLGQLVLVSPDIPVELIMPRRPNWLETSLAEFRELHLFSNDGDIVLKMISTVANYVMTPVRFWANGYRLGNMAVVRPPDGVPPFGVVNAAITGQGTAAFLGSLRLGWFTLLQRIDPIPLRDVWFDWFARRARQDPMTAGAVQIDDKSVLLPVRISYFDCTDSIDGSPRPTRGKQKLELSLLDNWQLALDAARNNPAVDVHSAYFYGPVTVGLIGKLAAVGLRRSVTVSELSTQCAAVHIRVLLAPELLREKAAS